MFSRNGSYHNYLTRKNYEYLSAARYARIISVELNHIPFKSITKGASKLYDELNTLIGEVNHRSS